MKRTLLTVGALLAVALPVSAQTTVPDSACLTPVNAARDSLARLHLPSVGDTTKLTQYQRRAYRTLSAFAAAKCVLPDTTVPDTTTPPPSATLTVGISGLAGSVLRDTLFVRPKDPYMIFYSPRVDSAGVQVADSVDWEPKTSPLAGLYWNRSARRLEVFGAKANGTLTLTFTRNELAVQRTVHVRFDTTTPPSPGDSTVASVSVGFDYTSQVHWDKGFGAVDTTGKAVICATIDRTSGARLLGEPAVTVQLVAPDSFTFTVRPETGTALSTLCQFAAGGIGTGTIPVTWTSHRIEVTPGGPRVAMPVAAAVIP